MQLDAMRVVVPEISDVNGDSPLPSYVSNTAGVAIPSIVVEVENILGPWRVKLKDLPVLTKSEMRGLRCGEWEEKHLGKI